LCVRLYDAVIIDQGENCPSNKRKNKNSSNFAEGRFSQFPHIAYVILELGEAEQQKRIEIFHTHFRML
jgi:hypothetical protein